MIVRFKGVSIIIFVQMNYNKVDADIKLSSSRQWFRRCKCIALPSVLILYQNLITTDALTKFFTDLPRGICKKLKYLPVKLNLKIK